MNSQNGNTSIYDFLSDVISLMKSGEYEATITNLSADCGVPVPYMRKTVLAMLKNHILRYCLRTAEEDDRGEEDSLMDLYLDHPKKISEKIEAGLYDDYPWEIDLQMEDEEEEILPLSHLEYYTVNSFDKTFLSDTHAGLFEKKELAAPISKGVRRNQEKILDAIERKKAISFKYRKPDNEIKEYTLYPKELIHNFSDHWIYMKSVDEKQFRLDRFVTSCEICDLDEPYPELSENPNEKYIWGAYFNKELNPIHVRLKIFPETGNIVEKIRNDVRTRLEAGIAVLSREGECYYYEDTIIGKEEFQRWIRGYGSSVLVLEPDFLREEIIQRAKETLDYYKASEEWTRL